MWAAVSGGVDSMVMLNVLDRMDFKLHALHVNFQLRDKASDLDQQLVADFCSEREIPFHLKRVEAADWKRNDLKGQSTQMAARTLRYEWFEEMVRESKGDKVALAHHSDDQAETVLLQVLRGGGMNALSGIKPDNGVYIRPLLEISKTELLEYAKETELPWRQDESNLESKYDRNLLRNKVFPILNEGFPGFQKVLTRNAKRWQGYASGIRFLIESLEKEWVKPINEFTFCLDFQALQNHPAGLLFLSQKLLEFDFHFDQVEQMYRSIPSNETRVWENESKTKTVLLRGEELIIKSVEKETPLASEPIQIHKPEGEYAFGKGFFKLQKTGTVPTNFKSTDKWTLYADFEKLEFPLLLRKAEPGDRIKPLGMKGKSKPVSEVIAEAKLDLAEMESVYVLADQKEVVWVLGLKISESICITNKSKEVVALLFWDQVK